VRPIGRKRSPRKIDCSHPPTQETTALAMKECVILEATIAPMNLLCFGGFRRGRMTHRSLGVGGYVFWWPRGCPWSSIYSPKVASPAISYQLSRELWKNSIRSLITQIWKNDSTDFSLFFNVFVIRVIAL
jgi:hypothetical protein